MHDQYNLERFVDAQTGVYDAVLSELRSGGKRSHWMWFIFPQLDGLGGTSRDAIYFAISGREEAKAYLDHPLLGARLLECTALVLKINARSVEEIFSWPDDLKFRSSMTLFDCIAPGTVFGQALQKFFDGCGDNATLAILTK